MPSLKDEIEGVLTLIDDNLEDINEFKEISHNIEIAFGIIAKRIMSIEKRLELIEDEIFKEGLTQLERKIMRIIEDETRAIKQSLINYTIPQEEITIDIIPRDDSENTEA